MGHYRSEMGYDERDRKEAEYEQKRMVASTAKIQAAIDERGIAAVLAELIKDDTMFRIRYR